MASVPVPAESIDLSEYNLQEGAAVVQARALVSVAYSQLERADRLGGEHHQRLAGKRGAPQEGALLLEGMMPVDEIKVRLSSAIDRVRTQEESIFRNLVHVSQ